MNGSQLPQLRSACVVYKKEVSSLESVPHLKGNVTCIESRVETGQMNSKVLHSKRIIRCIRFECLTQVNVPALQKIMVEFARENERSELTGELIGDTLDDALADEGDAEAENQIVSQVGSPDCVLGSLLYI